MLTLALITMLNTPNVHAVDIQGATSKASFQITPGLIEAGYGVAEAATSMGLSAVSVYEIKAGDAQRRIKTEARRVSFHNADSMYPGTSQVVAEIEHREKSYFDLRKQAEDEFPRGSRGRIRLQQQMALLQEEVDARRNIFGKGIEHYESLHHGLLKDEDFIQKQTQNAQWGKRAKWVAGIPALYLTGRLFSRIILNGLKGEQTAGAFPIYALADHAFKNMGEGATEAVVPEAADEGQ